MDLKQQIDSQVKKKLGTQSNFCNKIGIRSENYPRKWEAFTNHVNWINKFLKPLRGKVAIIWKDEKKS
jgi:hypothetical protein